MNYIEKLSNNKIGFTLNNGVLITRETFQYVSYAKIYCKNYCL